MWKIETPEIVADFYYWYKFEGGNPLQKLWCAISCVFKNYLDPRDKWYEIRDFWQRGKRGWANNDVMSLDYYLSGVIADSVDSLRGRMGVPLTLHDAEGNLLYDLNPRWEGDDPAPDSVITDVDEAGKLWDERLETIAAAFREYHHFDDAVTFEQMQENDRRRPIVKKAMMLFIQNFESLWS